MSAVDVGDAIELTFTVTPGATVTVSWYDPDGTPVHDHIPVPESSTTPGDYPYTLLPTAAGMWQALFTAAGTGTAVERYWVRATAVTGPPPLATIDEVADLYGTLTAAQETLVGALLRRASTLIRGAYPDLADRIAAGTLDADLVAHAAVGMVLRVLRNPAGLRSETVGPFTRTFDTAAAAVQLAITAAETSLLAPPRSGGPAATIMLRPGLAPTPTGLTDVHRW